MCCMKLMSTVRCKNDAYIHSFTLLIQQGIQLLCIAVSRENHYVK